MRKLRIGVLSTARIAVEKVIPGLQGSERCEVVAIASRDLDRARAAAQPLGIGTVHGSYEDLLADTGVDAVYNPLPNHLHAPLTVAAAEAGKHVLCEKPLALDADEARTMVDACERAGVVFVEAFMYRSHPQWSRVRELLDEGRLGELRWVQSAFSYDNPDPANIRNVAAYGGGGLMDIGCYCIDVSRWLLADEPERVEGAIRTDPEFGTDVLATGLLAFPGDRHASFTCSTRSANDQWVHLVGSEATLTVELPFNARPDAPTRLLVSDTGPHEPPQVLEVPPADQYGLQGDAFAAAVLDGAPVPTSGANGVANLRVIAALRAAAGPSADRR
ncbi:Gfo/Idh/MocA family protein [Egicoccus halophilus]|uniref:Deoxyfructose oxidoreductase n=1 Tax=Egicoccus halophilus TaxID=1670830 RepID=A0A8J3AGQ0_9ACTN|nr:Gfo/Idh/MocA family oxidoreductase [Egicoccus halophilus]GGI08606.1 deoxyfructose oxidoreductase [Egicoccus halophilus]